jgi:hypothetical protein
MQLTTIAACNNYLYAGTIHAYPSDPPNIICLNCPHIGEGVLLSIDNGKNWNPINSGLPDSIDVLSFAVSGGTIFAATSRGVFFLPPNGIQWVAFNDGLPSLNVSALAVNDKNLFAAITGGIVWQRPIADVTAEKELKIYHNQFEFKLIPPNGRNPKVSVIFSLQYSERIEITAYNLLGSKIATLVEKRFNKGQHCVSFNVSGLVSGCYTIKLKTETSIATKKMLLMQ